MLAMHLHCDGTYKIVWQGHTLIVGGTTDKAKQWHQLGVCISKNEKARDYEFFFNGLKHSRMCNSLNILRIQKPTIVFQLVMPRR